ncbi:MAG: hypothetical protein E6J41_26235 [Chloroflexi bacterium]|nr:MAG: hypothetical protein E6J41_26235 [Chloroflexota bacterium]
MLASVGQPLKAGGLTATLNAIAPSGTPSADEAQSSSAMFILAANPMLSTYPWLKASWTITNSGGQNDGAAFTPYLVTGAGILHPEELSSFLNCCSVGPGQSKSVPSFWAMQSGETTGPAYVVLLAVRNDGTSVTAVWKAR